MDHRSVRPIVSVSKCDERDKSKITLAFVPAHHLNNVTVVLYSELLDVTKLSRFVDAIRANRTRAVVLVVVARIFMALRTLPRGTLAGYAT
jgi:hypothetical protein